MGRSSCARRMHAAFRSTPSHAHQRRLHGSLKAKAHALAQAASRGPASNGGAGHQGGLQAAQPVGRLLARVHARVVCCQARHVVDLKLQHGGGGMAAARVRHRHRQRASRPQPCEQGLKPARADQRTAGAVAVAGSLLCRNGAGQRRKEADKQLLAEACRPARLCEHGKRAVPAARKRLAHQALRRLQRGAQALQQRGNRRAGRHGQAALGQALLLPLPLHLHRQPGWGRQCLRRDGRGEAKGRVSALGPVVVA